MINETKLQKNRIWLGGACGEVRRTEERTGQDRIVIAEIQLEIPMVGRFLEQGHREILPDEHTETRVL